MTWSTTSIVLAFTVSLFLLFQEPVLADFSDSHTSELHGPSPRMQVLEIAPETDETSTSSHSPAMSTEPSSADILCAVPEVGKRIVVNTSPEEPGHAGKEGRRGKRRSRRLLPRKPSQLWEEHHAYDTSEGEGSPPIKVMFSEETLAAIAPVAKVVPTVAPTADHAYADTTTDALAKPGKRKRQHGHDGDDEAGEQDQVPSITLSNPSQSSTDSARLNDSSSSVTGNTSRYTQLAILQQFFQGELAEVTIEGQTYTQDELTGKKTLKVPPQRVDDGYSSDVSADKDSSDADEPGNSSESGSSCVVVSSSTGSSRNRKAPGASVKSEPSSGSSPKPRKQEDAASGVSTVPGTGSTQSDDPAPVTNDDFAAFVKQLGRPFQGAGVSSRRSRGVSMQINMQCYFWSNITISRTQDTWYLSVPQG